MAMKLNVTCYHYLCRLNVCGNTLRVMKSTEKVPSLCLRLMGKRTRWVLDVNVRIQRVLDVCVDLWYGLFSLLNPILSC